MKSPIGTSFLKITTIQYYTTCQAWALENRPATPPAVSSKRVRLSGTPSTPILHFLIIVSTKFVDDDLVISIIIVSTIIVDDDLGGVGRNRDSGFDLITTYDNRIYKNCG